MKRQKSSFRLHCVKNIGESCGLCRSYLLSRLSQVGRLRLPPPLQQTSARPPESSARALMNRCGQYPHSRSHGANHEALLYIGPSTAFGGRRTVLANSLKLGATMLVMWTLCAAAPAVHAQVASPSDEAHAQADTNVAATRSLTGMREKLPESCKPVTSIDVMCESCSTVEPTACWCRHRRRCTSSCNGISDTRGELKPALGRSGQRALQWHQTAVSEHSLNWAQRERTEVADRLQNITWRQLISAAQSMTANRLALTPEDHGPEHDCDTPLAAG